MTDLNMLLLCFRKKMSAKEGGRRDDIALDLIIHYVSISFPFPLPSPLFSFWQFVPPGYAPDLFNFHGDELHFNAAVCKGKI